MKNYINLIFIGITLFFDIYFASAQNLILYEGKNYTGQSQIIPTSSWVDGSQIPLEGTPLNNKISSIELPHNRDNHFRLVLFDQNDITTHSKAITTSIPDLSQIDMNDKISLVRIETLHKFKASVFNVKYGTNLLLHFDDYDHGYRLFDLYDNKINYLNVEEGYAAILWENADDAHDKQNKGFGKVFVIQGTQSVGPGLFGKVSYIKVVPVSKLLESF
jgi:hypothetical protein